LEHFVVDKEDSRSAESSSDSDDYHSTTESTDSEEYFSSAESLEEWWNEYVSEDDYSDITISGKLVLLFDILEKCEEFGDKL
jgi:hypothetical protein